MADGTRAGWLIHDQDIVHAEAAAVTDAGLARRPWHQREDPAPRLDGEHQHGFVLGNPLSTRSRTVPRKDRLAVLAVLGDGRPRPFLLDAAAPTRQALTRFPRATVVDEAMLETWLGDHLPGLGQQAATTIRETLAVAASQAARAGPVVRLLVGDDAGQWAGVTAEGRTRCWIDAGRHVKQVTPCVPQPQEVLAAFLDRFWASSRARLAYRERPSPAQAARLEAACDTLFAPETGDRGGTSGSRRRGRPRRRGWSC